MIAVQEVMGTAIQVTGELTHDDGEVLFAVMRWIDATFSTYRSESDISRLDRGATTLAEVDPNVRAVLARCEMLQRATGGDFDHHANGHLDPSAFVKGWAGDVAARRLVARGATRFSCNVGGDVLCVGGTAELPWRVAVRHPLHAEAVVGVLQLTDGAVATSGVYERGEHMRRRASTLDSVTVVGPELGVADALSTAVFAGGVAHPAWMATFPEYDTLVVEDGQLSWTDGLADALVWPASV